jgi:hypothetical protein
MSKSFSIYTHFNTGEISDRLKGRVDLDKYKHGCETMENFQVLPEGGARRRGGIHYVADVKPASTGSELMPNGTFASNITGWTDKSVGTGSIAHSTNLMNIVSSNASNYGWAEEEIVTVAGQLYILGFVVGTGAINLQIGTSTGGEQIFASTSMAVGTYSTVEFRALTTATFIGFKHTTAATHTLDTVTLKKGVTDANVRMVRFQFSDTQAYMLEFGNLYVRFYKDNGRIEESGIAVELTTPYPTSVLFDLMFAQSADTMFIAHRDYAPRQIERTSHTDWTINETAFISAPTSFVSVADAVTNGTFRNNLTGWTVISGNDVTATGFDVDLDNSGTSAVIQQQVTVDSGQAYELTFNFTDHSHTTSTNRKLTVQSGSTAGGTDHLASTEVTTGQHSFTFTPGAATTYLRFSNTNTGVATVGAVSLRRTSGGTVDANTYPGAVTFYEQRLFWAGSRNHPQTFWGSQTGSYLNMDPATADADHSVQFSVAADSLDAIVWIGSARDLILGSYGSEHSANGGVDNAIQPASINVTLQSAFGSERIIPVNAGHALLFVARGGKKVREFVFNFDVDGFKAPDLTLLAAHITNNGITQMAYQQDPDSVCWCSTSTGELIGMTYLADQNVIAWHRHPLGGTLAMVESVGVIPDITKGEDQLWVSVKHQVNGVDSRYVGYLDPDLFVDHAVELNSPITISGATKANPVVITATAHGLSNGDQVDIENVAGMTELNNKRYTVSNQSTNTFELQNIESTPVNVDGTSYSTYLSGGEARLCVTTLSGLDYLEGESIEIVDRDTIVYSDVAVSGGSVTIPNSERVSRVYAGKHYDSTLKPVRPEYGSPQGMTQGKRKRWNKIGLRLSDTLGGTVNGDNIEYLNDQTITDVGLGLYTGDKMMDTTDWNPDGFVTIVQNKPLPMTVNAVFGDLSVGEIYGSDE